MTATGPFLVPAVEVVYPPAPPMQVSTVVHSNLDAIVTPVDPLVGMWCWYDEATPPALRDVAHGQIVGIASDGRHYLVRYDRHERIADGTCELVSTERIAAESWALFATEDELRAALEAKT